MIVRGDYSRPYSRKRRPSGCLAKIVIVEGIAIIALIYFVSQNLTSLRLDTLKAMGMAPAPTAFASDYAYNAADKFMKGDLEGAAKDYEIALRQQPDNVSYLYEYGRVLLELDRGDEALILADRAIGIAPNDVRGYALKANALAWEDPATSVTVSIQGEEIDPNFAPLFSARAIAYTNLGRYQIGEENGRLAIELDPMDMDARRAIVWPLTFLGKPAEAVEQLETAISINPNLTGPYFQLAAEYKNRFNDADTAIDIYTHILTNLNPSPAERARANLRICETIAGVPEADFSMAEPYCQEAIEILPTYSSAYKELGRMQYRRRNYEGAIETFEICERLKDPDEPGDIECWTYRGLAHFWLNNCDESWEILNVALERATRFNETGAAFTDINIGLGNVISRCQGYRNIVQPSPIPPTPIPPTPIGGL